MAEHCLSLKHGLIYLLKVIAQCVFCWRWISCCRKTRPRVVTHQKLKNSLTSNWLSTDLFRNNFHWPCIKQLIIKNNPLLHMYICFGFFADNQYFCLTMAFCAQGNKKSLTFHWLWQFIKDVPWPWQTLTSQSFVSQQSLCYWSSHFKQSLLLFIRIQYLLWSAEKDYTYHCVHQSQISENFFHFIATQNSFTINMKQLM